MTMDLYGHLFSEAPYVAISQLPSFSEALEEPEDGREDDPSSTRSTESPSDDPDSENELH